jgi:ABC-type dipeptide/oligopeptide/nickel transport system permease subunit
VIDAGARARFARSRSAWIGAGVVAALVLFAAAGPLVASHGPYESDFAHGVTPGTGLPVGPCRGFPLGADRIFRDVLARLAAGTQLTLAVASAATALATTIGAAVGIAAGYWEGQRVVVPWPGVAGLAAGVAAVVFGHPVLGAAIAAAGVATAWARPFPGPRLDLDGLLMRVVEVLLAFPFLILVMAVGAAVERMSATTVLVTLGLTGWLGTARLLRAKTMQVRSLEYIVAARALGQSTPRILWDHVLPNVSGTLAVTSTIQVAQMVVADSVLAYLGVGVAPPTPTWGRMLFEGQDYVASAPWLVLAPGGAILVAVWGFNLLGEGLRDALDPREV